MLGVVNFPPNKMLTLYPEILILGVYDEARVVFIQPEQPVEKGDKLG